MKRRSLFAIGAGALAAAAGIAAALWRDGAEPSDGRIWTLRLARPGGGELSFAELRGKPLLVNFWATWCAPCVTEMPLLARFHRERGPAGWQVVGIAVDREKPVQDFIAERRIDFPIGLAGGEGLELARALGNSAGGLPFSIAFDAGGRVKARRLGVLDQQTLEAWAAATA